MQLRPATLPDLALLRCWGRQPHVISPRGEDGAIDIWIGEEADLGRGYGTTMMRHALERCFAEFAVKVVLIDTLASNTRARRFYELLGLQCIERRTFGHDNCLVLRLVRRDWKSSSRRD